jgi:hypothetical protein
VASLAYPAISRAFPADCRAACPAFPDRRNDEFNS